MPVPARNKKIRELEQLAAFATLQWLDAGKLSFNG